MGISGRFFQGFGSVRVWFLVFRSCSVPVLFLFLFLVLGVLVLVVLGCSYSVLIPVLVRSCSGLVPFWLCSGPVLVLVLFMVLFVVLGVLFVFLGVLVLVLVLVLIVVLFLVL